MNWNSGHKRINTAGWLFSFSLCVCVCVHVHMSTSFYHKSVKFNFKECTELACLTMPRFAVNPEVTAFDE